MNDFTNKELFVLAAPYMVVSSIAGVGALILFKTLVVSAIEILKSIGGIQ